MIKLIYFFKYLGPITQQKAGVLGVQTVSEINVRRLIEDICKLITLFHLISLYMYLCIFLED